MLVSFLSFVSFSFSISQFSREVVMGSVESLGGGVYLYCGSGGVESPTHNPGLQLARSGRPP